MARWIRKPSATQQLFVGVTVLVVTLVILTGQLWISRFEAEERQLKNLILDPKPEMICQNNGGNGCLNLDVARLQAALEENEKSPLDLDSLVVPLALIFVTIALLFWRHQQQLRRAIAKTRRRIVSALDLQFEPIPDRSGEFQPLEDATVEIYRRQKELAESLRKEIQIEEQSKISKAVREQLIPPTQFGNERFEFFTHYEPAKGSGGDWWGFMEVGEKMIFGIGDASGTGISTAFVVAGVRSAFTVLQRMTIEQPQTPLNPADILNLMNRIVYEIAGSKVMMTLFLGIIDFKEQTITYSNAAHNPPWIFRKKGESDFEKFSLIAEGLRLGESLKNPAFEEKTHDFRAGDVLVLYTDGMLENKNRDSDSFGKKQARAIIEANLVSGTKLCLNALVDQIHDHNQGKDLDDDVTVVMIQALAQ